MKTATKTNRKNSKTTKAEKTNGKVRMPMGPETYTGAPIAATKLYTRRMSEFKNTTADCLLLINETSSTYTFANTYRSGILPKSYDAAAYTFKLDEAAQKRLDKKIEEQGFQEVERPDWPSWVIPAAKRGRKSN